MKKLVGGLFLICLTVVGISLLILKAQEELDTNLDTQDATFGDNEQFSMEDFEEYLKKLEEKGEFEGMEGEGGEAQPFQMPPEDMGEIPDEQFEEPGQQTDQSPENAEPMTTADDENEAMMQEQMQP